MAEKGKDLTAKDFSTKAYPFGEKLFILLFDFLAIIAGFFFGTETSKVIELSHAGPRLSAWLGHSTGSHLVCYISSVLLLFYWLWERGHYFRRLPFWEEQRRLLKLIVSAGVVEAVLLFALSEAPFERRAFFATWVLVGGFMPVGRITAKRILMSLGFWSRSTIIVGIGENAKRAFIALRQERQMGFPIVGFACLSESDLPKSKIVKVADVERPVVVLGKKPGDTLTRLGCQNVVVAMESLDGHANLIHALSARNRNVMVLPSIAGLPLYGVDVSHFFSHETLMLSVRNNLARSGARLIKRVLDVFFSLVLIVALSPLLVLVVLRIRSENGAPAIFAQERIGLDGRVFRFLKFRSMVRDAENILSRWRTERPELWDEYQRNNFKLRDDPRMLRVGRWIRRTSIDELPQLFNVLKGEMSLVGPRPLLGRELTIYGDTIELYKQVRPGITGLWQISGRSKTKFADRAAYDAWYVRNWSLWYDFVILLRTVKVVFLREGAY